MKLIVGLGNPGASYKHNRHNIGFMAVEEIVRQHSFSLWRKKFSAELAEGSIAQEKIVALLPQTYMNLSGQSVTEAIQFYKIPPSNVIVFHDDLDLLPGHVRIKKGGGHGGHNGLRSLDQHIGPEYWRVRLGIGHPGNKENVTRHVLNDFHADERKWLEPLLHGCAQNIHLVIEDTPDAYAQSLVNLRPDAGQN